MPASTLGWMGAAGVFLAATAAAVAGPAATLLQGGALTVPQVLLCDALFTGGALALLYGGLEWGLGWHPGAAPYRGAWLDARGKQVLPAGFSRYLPAAGLLSFLLPLGALGAMAVTGGAAGARAGSLLLGGYLPVFFVQALLETKLFHRNPLSPAVPFVFGAYRFWQLGRSLWALGAAQPAAAAAPAWAPHLLIFLLAFWCFDHGVTAVQLPWVFNWHLQAPIPAAVPDGGKKE